MKSFIRAVCDIRIRRGLSTIPVGAPVDMSVDEFNELSADGHIVKAQLFTEWEPPKAEPIKEEPLNIPRRSLNYASERRRIRLYEENHKHGNG